MVNKPSQYERKYDGRHVRIRGSENSPCEYILSVVVSEIDLCCSTNRDAFGFSIICPEKVGFCSEVSDSAENHTITNP